ncbi:MAG: photosynthetic reaction center subunit H [Serpentinimonas sp.]|nr:photosynthetic reaction center subunit H [Serpentinimonas sp.]
METGAITGYIDVAQVVLYVFWAFFAGLIYYLHQEGKREGYPLESDRSKHIRVEGWPPMPSPKTYKTQHYGERTVPNDFKSPQTLHASPIGNWPGAPLQPHNANPMLDGVGPGAWADRPDVPDMTYEGTPRIVPLRADGAFGVSPHDPDPRGKNVVGADGKVGGVAVDVWVDRSEMLFRYIEVEVDAEGGKRRVLLPMNFARVGNKQINVKSILGGQFAQVPGTKQAEVVTYLEEEKIMAYYGAGTLYATPSRQEPLI